MNEPLFNSVPDVIFAHAFTADSYRQTLASSRDIIEITYITEGSLSLSSGGVTETAFSGDVITNRYEAPLTVDARSRHSHHTVCFTFETKEPFSAIPLVTRSGAGTSQICRLIDGIIMIHTLYPDERMRPTGLFIQLVGELCALSDRPVSGTPGEILYVKRAKEYIYDHITEPLMQKTVAAYLDISPEYLCLLFRKIDGRSVIRFINEIKLESIKDLMQTRGVSLCRAAEQYGYSDGNYVSRLYKKYYNESITAKKQPKNK